MALFDQIKLLYDNGLYSNVITLSSLVLTINENNRDTLTISSKYQILVYYGNALFYNKEYKKSESVLKKALQLRKASKVKGKSQSLIQSDATSEVDVKYQIYLCNIQMKQYSQAITILETILSKQRTPKINMALAKLYHMNGMERSAITSYKEILKECPLAFEAAQGLLSLGIKGAEVASLMLHGTVNISNSEWISTWIKAHAHFYSKEFNQSIATFKQLEYKTHLRDNVDILVSLAEASYYNGDSVSALLVLERAHRIDPFMLRGMDLYACLLYKEKKGKELEAVCSQAMATSEAFPEPWVVTAYHCHNVKKGVKPLYFVQKALMINPRHVEALILKGMILLDLKKVQDAITSFREAYRIVPYRYEALKGLVDCYLSVHRIQEACSISCGAIKQIGKTPRTLTLYASVLIKDPISAKKAKGLLEEVLKLDPSYLTAVYLLAEIYDQEKQYTKGIELLKKQAESQSTCRLHQMLGDFLARSNEHEKALQHFSIALNFEPNNTRAIEGTQRVEQNPEYIDNAFDVEDIEDSENDVDLEDSEVETWSDVDYT